MKILRWELISLAVVIVCATAYGILNAKRQVSEISAVQNFKQLGFAFDLYHESYGVFPPAHLTDENGSPTHSWRVLILPFVQQENLYKQYSFDEPWDSEANLKLLEKMPDIYSDRNAPWGTKSHETVIQAVVGPETVINSSRPISYKEIKDGSYSSVTLISNYSTPVPWTQPVDISVADFTDKRNIEFSVTGKILCVMAEGSVLSLKQDISPNKLKAIATINDGLDPGDF